jgi:hypothetical protein
MIKKFVLLGGRSRAVNKKFKGVQKIPYKAPKKIKQLTRDDIKLRHEQAGDINLRNKISNQEWGNWSHKSLEDLRGESLAGKISIKRFDRSLERGLKYNRLKIAKKLKGRSNIKSTVRPHKYPTKVAPLILKHSSKQLSVKSPLGITTNYRTFKTKSGKFRVFKDQQPLKSKIGTSSKLKKWKDEKAITAYNKANKDSEGAFRSTMRRFTDKTKSSTFKHRSESSMKYTSGFGGESANKVQLERGWGFQGKDFEKGISSGGKISKKYSNYLDMEAKGFFKNKKKKK